MRHPDEGTLRRLLDDPAGCPDDDRAHAAGCDDCTRSLAAMRADADLVRTALAVDVPHLDVDAAWQRLRGAPPATAPRRTTPARRPSRWRQLSRRPAVAGAAFAAVLIGAGTAAANDWFQIFETQRIEPISVSAGDLLDALPDLDDYGDMTIDGRPDVRVVDDAAAAEEATDLSVPEVAELPRGVNGEPRYRVGNEVTATFTYDADDAGAAPPGLDGGSIRMVAGPGLAAVWSQDSGVPVLLVGRAVAPMGYATGGVTFEAMRDHLLTLDLPEDVASSLRAFNADGSTFPLPVPDGLASTTTADVNGDEATVLTSRDRTLAAVAWVDDGIVTVVAGALDQDEVLEIARELR